MLAPQTGVTGVSKSLVKRSACNYCWISSWVWYPRAINAVSNRNKTRLKEEERAPITNNTKAFNTKQDILTVFFHFKFLASVSLREPAPDP